MYVPSNTLIPLIELNAEKMRGRPTIITPHDGTTTRISRCGGDACIVLRRVYDTGTHDITHKRYIYDVQHTLPGRIYDANVRAVSPDRGDASVPAPPYAAPAPTRRNWRTSQYLWTPDGPAPLRPYADDAVCRDQQRKTR